MIWKRQLAIFGLAFVLVLGGGMALAAVGSLGFPDEGAAPGEPIYEEPAEEPAPVVDSEQEVEHEQDATADEEAAPDEAGPNDEEAVTGDEEATGDEQEATDEPQDEAEEPAEEADTTPPGFEILSPANGTRVDNKVVTFKGYVEPGSTVTRGKFSAEVDGEHWRIALVLSPGKNIVGFVGTDAAGNKADDSVTVYYDPPQAQETDENEDSGKEDGGKEEPEFVEFSANQKYGSCSENPPYDVFSGTATPGTKIWIESPYGGTSLEANGDGRWSAKVTFWESPIGKTFEVVIESGDGNRKVFAFTRTGSGEEDGGDK